ncbi:MAG: imidazolonepropionase, partial [SAR324 cluster bacterium]|nr:imidazolonepropionase [SAR324 cluster bacterium]
MNKGGAAYGLIEDGAIAVQDGTIAWTGSASELPGPVETLAREVRDGEGMCITPGLIDSHTHLVYAGNRAREFEMRLEGASYEELAKAGGGILSTVEATRNASEEALFEASKPRLMSLLEEGVTTVEIKSGYGLETETECRMLRVARKLESELPVSISTSFLGAHALPAEFQGRSDDYIDLVCGEMISEVA